MGKDRFMDRFLNKRKKQKLNEMSRKNTDPDLLDEEERILAETKPVDPIKGQSEPGRNDPCPCGSGKKYKKCCALTDDKGKKGKKK